MSSYITNPVSNELPAQYSNLRAVLAPEYALLPSAEIEALMESMFGPGAAERYEDDLEGFFSDIGGAISSAARDVGRFAAKAAPVVANIGGGVLKGATAGSALGLPGIIGGAIAGGVGTGLSSYAKGPARDIGNILGTVTNVAGQFSPAGRLGAGLAPAISGLAGGGGRGAAGAAVSALGSLLGGGTAGTAVNALGGLLGGGQGGGGGALSALSGLFGGSSAASQLLSALRRPETMQALAALGLGKVGRDKIPVGSAQTPVPVAGIANLIGQLANQAAAEAAALSDGAESALYYMMDQTGEYVGDPASEQERAARVWELLNEAQAERVLNAIYQQSAESLEEASYCPHCGGYRDDVYGDTEFDEFYEFSGEDYPENDAEDLTEDYGDWDEDILYEYV